MYISQEVSIAFESIRQLCLVHHCDLPVQCSGVDTSLVRPNVISHMPRGYTHSSFLHFTFTHSHTHTHKHTYIHTKWDRGVCLRERGWEVDRLYEDDLGHGCGFSRRRSFAAIAWLRAGPPHTHNIARLWFV